MRRIVLILPLLLACTQMRESVPVEFVMDETRAFQETTISSLDGFYVTARNTSGKVLWGNQLFVKDQGGSRFTGGMYWPQSGQLSFYAISRNYPQTVDAGGVKVQPSPADGDVVSAVRLNASPGSSTYLSFGHIFACLEGIVFTPDDGCSVNVTALSCRFTTGGTYDIAGGSWEDTGAPGAAVSIASPSLENRNLGLLCVPGECIISVSYDCSFGGHTESCTTSATVTLPMGKKTTVSGTLKTGSGIVSMSVTVIPWNEEVIINNNI